MGAGSVGRIKVLPAVECHPLRVFFVLVNNERPVLICLVPLLQHCEVRVARLVTCLLRLVAFLLHLFHKMDCISLSVKVSERGVVAIYFYVLGLFLRRYF